MSPPEIITERSDCNQELLRRVRTQWPTWQECRRFLFRHTSTSGWLNDKFSARREYVITRRRAFQVKHLNEYVYNEHHRKIKRLRAPGGDDVPTTFDFPYRPFTSPDQIRIFALNPGDQDAPLSGRLLTDCQDDAPSYEAISHVWTQSGGHETLEVDGQSFTVSKSIGDLLRHLRFQSDHRRLWLDLLCINQQDTAERNAQVRLMGSIYSNALRTIVWLGNEDEHTVGAISLIRDAVSICELAHMRHGFTDWKNGFSRCLATGNVLADLGFPRPSDPRWVALNALLQRPWFFRTWILQEVTLAKATIIHCGAHWFLWRDLCYLERTMDDTKTYFAYGINMYAAHRVVSIQWIHSVYGQSDTLLNMASITRAAAATDPRDKIFALMSLAIDAALFQDLVDYNESNTVARVFTEVAATYLEQPNSDLLTLHMACDAPWKLQQNLPTWVPDFTVPESSFPFYWHAGSREKPCGCPPPHVSEDRTRLHIRGILKTSVKAVGRRLHGDLGAESPDALIAFEQWRYLVSRKPSRYRSVEHREEAFARTLVAANAADPPDGYDSFAEAYHAYRRQRRHWAPAVKTLKDGRYASFFTFHENATWVTRHRTFFITADGHIGIGPYFLQREDLVVRFHKGRTPFIVRRVKDGGFKLVGDAYVHDMMEPDECRSPMFEEIQLF